MGTFTWIWCGQLVSGIGSRMTFFALTLWAWEQTGSATALALVGFFFQLPRIPAMLFAGPLVDRVNRKRLMLLGDAVSAFATLVLGALYLAGQLDIWHLYWVAAIAGGFGQVQTLAYQASVALIVPPRHYTRAGSMAAVVFYSSGIAGPALAGVLYPRLGLAGIVGLDFATFAFAFVTLAAIALPQPQAPAPESVRSAEALTFGVRQIWQQPHLKVLLLLTVLFTFAHDLGGALYSPMILARTNGSARTLARVSAATGDGGMTGAALIGIWGGPKHRFRGMLGGFVGAGLSKIAFGLGRSLSVWMPAQISSSLNFPLLGSCRSALWLEAVASEKQGRVLAANSMAT